MEVFTWVGKVSDWVDRKAGRLWTNAKSVSEAAMMALHRAAREGWRGRMSVAAWTSTMASEGYAHAILATIDDGEPEPSPKDDRVNYAESYKSGLLGS